MKETSFKETGETTGRKYVIFVLTDGFFFFFHHNLILVSYFIDRYSSMIIFIYEFIHLCFLVCLEDVS